MRIMLTAAALLTLVATAGCNSPAPESNTENGWLTSGFKVRANAAEVPRQA